MVTDGDMENQEVATTNHVNNHTSPYKELANNSLVINKDSSSKMLNHVKENADHAHKHKDSSSKHKENSSSKPKDSFKIPLKDPSGKPKDHNILNNNASKTKDSSLTFKDSNKLKESSPHKDKLKESSSHKDHSASDSSKHNNSSPSKHKESSSKNNEHKDKSPILKDESKIKDKEHRDKDKKHKEKDHKEKSHKEHKDKDHKEHKSKEHKEHKEKDHKENKEKVHKENKEKDHKENKEKEHKENKEKAHKEHKEKEHKENKEKSHKEHKEKEHKENKEKEHKENKEKEHKDKEKKHKDKEHKNKEKEKHKDIKKESSPIKVKEEPASPRPSPSKAVDEDGSEDDTPLVKRQEKSKDVKIKTEIKKEFKSEKKSHDDSDDEPLSSRAEKVIKVKSEDKKSKKRKFEDDDDDYYDDDDDYKQETKKIKKEKQKKKDHKKEKSDKKRKTEEVEDVKPKKKKKEEEEVVVWKWWEEDKANDGKKWQTLEHKGPVFAPAYEPLPSTVKFYYDGKAVKLSLEAEEVAGFYGKMLEHDYTTKQAFNTNFFKDWRKVMTAEEKNLIQDLKKCNFKMMFEYFQQKSEERKAMSKEAKQALKKANEDMVKEYGFCIIDGHKEKIGNFKIEPPGLFRGRGEHPKMGKLKKRTMPEEITINCGKDSKIPSPPAGHKWKEVRHDNTVTWLASWNENVQGQTKYIMLNPSSKLKGEKDWQKYETARKLKKCVDKIRANYRQDWKSKEMRVRQRAVALYFIDKLALRAGNEKEEGETADTVGCCSLRVEHITLFEELDGKEFVVEFDFLGKDSIRYQNSVSVEKRVFKNLKLFMENKQPGDDVFDRLNTAILNKHLSDLMEGLTAKVFRTYNASKTLQDQLNLLTKPEDSIPAKILSYNRANRAVAILCNHQRAKPKAFEKQMENFKVKIDGKKDAIKEAKRDAKKAKQNYKSSNAEKDKQIYDRKKKLIQRLEDQLTKLEVSATDKEENKEIALGTSKLNYLDPRISVAWCKKWDVPIEKIYNRTQRDKFRWAIDMATPEYEF